MSVDLLEVRDAGESLSLPERALLLAGTTGEAVASLEPVGRTTARLLRLHQEIAGPLLEGTVPCPACATTVEFAVSCAALGALEPEIADEPTPLDLDGVQVRFRPVAYADLVEAVRAEDGAAMVLGRCVEGAALDGPELRSRVSAAMAAADPLAEVDLDLECPGCSEPVRAEVDVATFVWTQVEARAQALLAEVDVLARAYSWSEAAILAMSPTRRRRFVALVTGEA